MAPRNPATKPDFEISKPALTSSSADPDVKSLTFERADWTSFRTEQGLQQKSGVAAGKLRRLVLKELTDNALDTGARVRVGELKNGGYFVEDAGPGIDGTSDQIARLFSIGRPMISTKLLRLPTRGALGNGLRVVAGSVLASDGWLIVTTMGQRISLRPERDGTTSTTSVKTTRHTSGTRIEIGFGPAIPEDKTALLWAYAALGMSAGQSYTGKSSPHWYDVPQFHELLQAAGDRPVRELVANLDGCAGARAGEIVTEAKLARMSCADVTAGQAATLLKIARASTRQVTPKRLGAVGCDRLPDYAYARTDGTVSFGLKLCAEIPFVIEAWAAPAIDDMALEVYGNRTPVAADISAERDKRDLDIHGCGLHNSVAEAPKDKFFEIRINITTPFMPITSDGKEPDLAPFLNAICDVVQKVVNKAHRPASRDQSQKAVVLDNLERAIADVSGEEGFRFNDRQLLYVLRPIVRNETGQELKEGNFKSIIADYENEHGEIPKMYSEPRGSITHPHRNETITLGTLMVEEYERPPWTFNKILYIEKEGANEALKEVRWPERHDCAIMSSKGYSTRAAKDLIDKLVEHDELVDVFCAHDADAFGTMIFQTLQDETKARQARRIRIVNIGLEPWEAVDMGLEVENVEEGKRHKAVADYVLEHKGGARWSDWLQDHRVELNAMTTPQFISWLDGKMAKYAKLVPPADVLEAELARSLEAKIGADLTDRILREGRLDARVAAAIAAIKPPSAATLKRGIGQLFKAEQDRTWRDHIEAVAMSLKPRG